MAHWQECIKDKRFTCDWIYNILVVLSDGKVVCGCADPYGERPLGHLKNSTLLEIWNSEKVHQIRRDLNNGHCCFCDPCGLKRPLQPGEVPPQGPIQVDVLPRMFFEPTVRCNLSCFEAVCSHQSGIVQTREQPDFPLGEFKALLDHVGDQLIRLDLFNYGDPFAHPRAVDMIEYVKERYPNIYLYTSTNGLLLNREKIKRLVKAGLDEITFSVDGADQKTYEKYRRNGNLGKVLKIMSDLVDERDRSGWEVPFINWRYIIFRWNHTRRHLDKTRALAKQIGVDRLTWEITDHPPSAKSERYQIGTADWRRIYHEIWDSSQIGNAIKQKRFLAKLKVVPEQLTADRGETEKISVRIKNKGGALWRTKTRSGRRIVRMGAQLYDKNRLLIDLNFARCELNHDMAAGDRDTLKFDLPSPDEPGLYWLKFDMVSEGIDWFESGGSAVVWKRLCVN